MDRKAALILTQSKSTGVAVVLTILFGGLGLFYASVTGGIVVTLLQVIATIIAVITFGFGIILLIPVWFIALIWAVIAVGRHNKRLVTSTA